MDDKTKQFIKIGILVFRKGQDRTNILLSAIHKVEVFGECRIFSSGFILHFFEEYFFFSFFEINFLLYQERETN